MNEIEFPNQTFREVEEKDIFKPSKIKTPTEVLADLGKSGWELISTHTSPSVGQYDLLTASYVFKRKK